MKIHFVPHKEHFVLPVEVEWVVLYWEIRDVGENTCKKALFLIPQCRWDDCVKVDLEELGWEGRGGLDRCGSGQGQVLALVSAVMNLWVPSKARNFLAS